MFSLALCYVYLWVLKTSVDKIDKLREIISARKTSQEHNNNEPKSPAVTLTSWHNYASKNVRGTQTPPKIYPQLGRYPVVAEVSDEAFSRLAHEMKCSLGLLSSWYEWCWSTVMFIRRKIVSFCVHFLGSVISFDVVVVVVCCLLLFLPCISKQNLKKEWLLAF